MNLIVDHITPNGKFKDFYGIYICKELQRAFDSGPYYPKWKIYFGK